MTAPPLNAVFRALPMPLVLAAEAVRPFALMPAVMPTKPARPEQVAPRMKQSALFHPTPSAFLRAGINPKRARTAAMPRMKMAMILYSFLMNAKVPSLM